MTVQYSHHLLRDYDPILQDCIHIGYAIIFCDDRSIDSLKIVQISLPLTIRIRYYPDSATFPVVSVCIFRHGSVSPTCKRLAEG